MTGYERIKNVLAHKPVDRIPVFEHFWGDTHREYEQQGHVQPGESFEDHFNLDMQECWAFNLMADLDFKRQVVAETEDTITYLDGNGAYLKRHKFHDTTPEHVRFTVEDREGWEEYKNFFWNPMREESISRHTEKQKQMPRKTIVSLSGPVSMCLKAFIQSVAMRIC